MSKAGAAFRGWRWLTASMLQRFLREGMVLRSMVFPVALTIVVMVGTVAAVTWRRADVAAITPALATPTLRAAIEEAGGQVIVSESPEALVRSGDAAFGSDGATLWINRSGFPRGAIEGVVRKEIGAAWRRVETRAVRTARTKVDNGSTRIALFIGALFAMYGVVFGAGAIARDREDGTLDSELSVALPMWVTPLARWSAATIVLGLFFAMSVWMLHAVVGLASPWLLSLGGATAGSTASAVGMAAIGRGGKTVGFAGPMSVGLVVVMGLFSLGLSSPALAPHVPIASLGASSLGVAPLIALALGPLYAWWFATRVGVG